MQNFSVTGINHKYAPLEVREVLAIADESLPIALRALRENHAVEQAMILSTCNRIEIICHASCPAMKDRVCDYLSAYHHVDRSFFEEYVYYHQGIDAVRHIFNVASGLDSMVLGETEILGQLKKAYLASSSEGATGRALNECMHAAFALAKKIHADTEISKGKLSVASVAVTFVKRIFDDLSRKTAMLVGLGETGRLLLTHLREAGIGHMIVVNRTLEHATNVAKTFNADAVPLELLEDYLARADIVISQTSAPTTIVSRAHVENALKRRHGKPMLLIDLAVPRDIQADVEELEGAYLYDIDDLEQVVAEAAEARTQEYERCQKLVDERIEAFVRHTGRQMVEPLISALHERAGAIVESELEHASLGNLTPEQREEVLRLTHRVVNKLLHPPTAFLKEEFQNGGVDARLLNISARMFGLPAPEQPPISEQRSANKDIAPQFIVAEQPEDATINRGATPPRLNRASLPISETKDTT